jgi:hypothetical protein
MSTTFDQTRMGEVFASIESRNPQPGSPEYSDDVLQAQRLVAAAYFLDVLTNALAGVPTEKRSETLGPTLHRYLSFLSLVAPALFANPDAERKTKAAIAMALKDLRDIAAKAREA